jgi:hypothetical protein
MRVLLLAAASIAIMTASFDAEARARGRGSATYHIRHTTVQGAFVASPARPAPDGNRAETWAVANGASPFTGPAETRLVQGTPGAAGDVGAGRSDAPGRAAVASAPVMLKGTSQPEWCPTKRVAGSGSGFCLVN